MSVDTKVKQLSIKSDAKDCKGFSVKVDIFNGITIDSKYQQWANEVEFENRLSTAITEWKEEGIKGLWVKIHKDHAQLTPICVKFGFDFHHAQPGYVMMCQWLPKEENTLPGYANQYLGVAGFVVNDKKQVLVIQEKFNVGQPHWKLPGGLADKGEDLATTCRREVFEETGVDAEFVSVLSFRHQHNFRFGCSDWYFVCLMSPVNEDINMCRREIAACQWMDLEEYASHPSLTDGNKYMVEAFKESLSHDHSASIKPSQVLSYNKKFYHNIYSVHRK